MAHRIDATKAKVPAQTPLGMAFLPPECDEYQQATDR
jgi:hypothetical protein